VVPAFVGARKPNVVSCYMSAKQRGAFEVETVKYALHACPSSRVAAFHPPLTAFSDVGAARAAKISCATENAILYD